MATMLTPEDKARSEALLRPCRVDTNHPRWKALEADGWDTSLIFRKLELTAAERLQELDRWLDQVEQMREAFREQHASTRASH